MSKTVNMGIIKKPNPCNITDGMPLAASVAFKALGGKFVTKDGSGNFALSVAGDTQIDGWMDVGGDFTSNAIAAVDKLPIVIDNEAVCEIPVDSGSTALTAAGLKILMFKTCDLVVTAGIQGANTGASSTDVVKIVGGNVAANTVYVTLNATKMFTRGVA